MRDSFEHYKHDILMWRAPFTDAFYGSGEGAAVPELEWKNSFWQNLKKSKFTTSSFELPLPRFTTASVWLRSHALNSAQLPMPSPRGRSALLHNEICCQHIFIYFFAVVVAVFLSPLLSELITPITHK